MHRLIAVAASFFILTSAHAQMPSPGAVETGIESNIAFSRDMAQQVPGLRDKICARQASPSDCRNDRLFSDLQQIYEGLATAFGTKIRALRSNNSAEIDMANRLINMLSNSMDSSIKQIAAKYPR